MLARFPSELNQTVSSTHVTSLLSHSPPKLILSQTESAKTVGKGSHISAGATFWRRESDCWCRPFGLHQGCSSETSRIGTFSYATPRMDRKGPLHEQNSDELYCLDQ